MKRILRRLAAFAAALLLVCRMAAPQPEAVLSGVYFTVVNNSLMEMNSETMPYWSGGELYVSIAVFYGDYGKDLGVSCNYNRRAQTVILYNLRKTLYFDLATGECTDQQNNRYQIKMVARGDYAFFQLSPVASYFNLTWSYLATDWVPLIRIKSDSVVLSDAQYLDAATTPLRTFYTTYERSVTPPAQDGPVTPPVAAAKGQRVYLMMTACEAAEVGPMLDILGQYGKQATFALTASQMEGQDDLLRRLVGQGHAVAIALEGDTEEAAIRELAAANAALWQAACAKTRLVYLTKEQGARHGAVEDRGYTACEADLDYSARPVNSARRAAGLYAGLTTGSAGRRVFLGDAVENIAGMASLLGRLQSGDCRVLAYRENLG